MDEYLEGRCRTAVRVGLGSGNMNLSAANVWVPARPPEKPTLSTRQRDF